MCVPWVLHEAERTAIAPAPVAATAPAPARVTGRAHEKRPKVARRKKKEMMRVENILRKVGVCGWMREEVEREKI